ncbi:hypothetical protein [Pseudomonas massiliensis]|uniref:hypothetical protein n=1 Tax=Pseudomonas massiliensis TaxID=522492 RepID=UPI0011DD59F9|nr:hypothetical protein [Pseudomonas massiliensis]
MSKTNPNSAAITTLTFLKPDPFDSVFISLLSDSPVDLTYSSFSWFQRNGEALPGHIPKGYYAWIDSLYNELGLNLSG